jgi:hypothetical protein
MTHALTQRDYMCWYYNRANNLASETTREPWWPKDRFPSLAAAKAAARAPSVNNVASGIHFATTLGEANIAANSGDASFGYTLDYENHTGSKESITYLEKPDWIRAAADHATISGVPPAAPRTDTLVAVISAAGRSDRLKLTIVTSATSARAEFGTDK